MPPSKARVVAFANNKGGVRKTSTVTNVGGELAAAGLRVLVVGLDTQAGENISHDLGYADQSDHGASLAAAMCGQGSPRIIHDVRPGLDVIADGPALEQVVEDVYGRHWAGQTDETDAFWRLREALEPVLGPYDVALLDCPPNQRVLIRAALGAARWVVIPTATDAGSIDSLAGTAREFAAARKVNPDLELAGIIITGSNRSAVAVRRWAGAKLAAMFGSDQLTFTSFTRFAEASAVRARQEHLLVRELAAQEQAAEPRWKKLRRREKVGWTTSSAGLAEDYHQVALELAAIITAEETGERA